MGAAKGNEFWKLRSKHGRDKLFATPELLLEAAEEYFAWCVANPLIEVQFLGKDAVERHVPRIRAFTLQALCLYLGANTKYLAQFKIQLREKDDEISNGFSNVITHIEETIYNQKFVNAAAGFLKENLISRDLGLMEKTEMDVTSKGEKLPAPVINMLPPNMD